MKLNTVSGAFSYGRQFLKECGIQSFSLDSRLLLSFVLGKSDIYPLTHGEREIGVDAQKNYISLLEKRGNGIPLAYLTGEKEFMSLSFSVNEFVLIPRPETEILTEFLINIAKERRYTSALEIGTGSGAVSVSLCKYSENIKITACDISEKALEVAARNSERHGVGDRIDFVKSDIFTNIAPQRFDIVFSNPPYIKSGEMPNLSKEVLSEPCSALDGGYDGLRFYREITSKSAEFLSENGVIAYEIGFDQGVAVKNILAENKFSNITVLNDLNGLNRVVTGIKTFARSDIDA